MSENKRKQRSIVIVKQEIPDEDPQVEKILVKEEIIFHDSGGDTDTGGDHLDFKVELNDSSTLRKDASKSTKKKGRPRKRLNSGEDEDETPQARSKRRKRNYLLAMTPEERETYRAQERERKRRARIELPPEKRAEILAKQRIRSRVKRDQMMDPERLKKREEFREIQRLHLEQIRAERVRRGEPEINEAEDEKEKRRLYYLERRKRNQADDNERVRVQQKNYRRNLTPEQRELRREKDKFYNITRRIKMTPEDKAKRNEYQKNYYRSLTGEKKQRWVEMTRRACAKANQKQYVKNPDKYVKFLDYQKQRTANETPEQRQKRLRGYKINQARKKLKKQLEEIEMPEEEIQRRINILVEEMKAQPLPPLSEYKPRARTSKPKKLEEFEELKKNVNKPVPSIPPPTGFFNLNYPDPNVSILPEVPPPPPPPGEYQYIDDAPELHDDLIDYDLGSFQEPLNFEASHPKGPLVLLTCSECQSTFTSRDDLITHLILFHSEKCWRCPQCSEVMLSPDEFSEHFKTHDTPPPATQESVEPPTFKFDLKSIVTLQEPPEITVPKVRTRTPVATYKFDCFRCDKKFKSLKPLTNHVRIKHPSSYWPCEHCGLLKYSEESLLYHQPMCDKKK